MRLTVLTDNNTIIDQYYIGEPAVSYYIEDDETRILFDTGYSDVYVKNAEKLGIDLTLLDAVVLSHGHNDHTGGLAYFPRTSNHPKLIGHPLVLERKRVDQLAIGSPLCEEELAKHFEIQLSLNPVQVSPNLIFLGEIPRINSFEDVDPIGERLCGDIWQPDYLYDDSALVYVGNEGISVITGCSHSGICNIIEYAKRVTGISNIEHVIGGFHLLKDDSQQLRYTADYLKNVHIPHLYPCHCTSFAAKAVIHRNTPVNEVGIGMTFEW